MWRARAILLLIIAAILGAVAAAYYFQKRALGRQAPPPPKSLPLHVDAAAQDWRWSQTREGRPVVEVRARRFRQIKEPSHFQLEHVEVQLYKSDARSYDLVSSAQAKFDLAARKLYSEGEVQIVLGLPASGAAREKPVTIRSSGVTFESNTGKASTERAAAFEFRNGTGSSVGAAYDPNSRELHLRSRAELNWLPAAPGGKPMKVEAGEMIYKETAAQVLLL